MSEALSVVVALSGVSTCVSRAGSADVPCTYCLSDTRVAVPGVARRMSGSITAGSVFAGRTEKYTVPVAVSWPSETVRRTVARPAAIAPAWNVSRPSARVETVASSVFSTVALTSVSGSPSSSVNAPSTLPV